MWVVGIDEAGYGPNLGPLVQTAIALKLPAGDPAGWETLQNCMRRAYERADGRLLIDDSKKVYSGGKGFDKLERGVLACLSRSDQRVKVTFATFLNRTILNDGLADIRREPWFDGATELPLEAVDISPVAWGDVAIATPRVNLVQAAAFNRIVAASGSKATVLGRGLVELLRESLHAAPGDEPVLALCDKQGGRNFYAPMLQEAFPAGWIVCDREAAAESRYRVLNLSREVTVVFRPRADGDSVSVALASMLAKYLREVCMRQFNAFWQSQVPGIAPTAGYPLDAKRFYAAIQPAMERLGIEAGSVWRVK